MYKGEGGRGVREEGWWSPFRFKKFTSIRYPWAFLQIKSQEITEIILKSSQNAYEMYQFVNFFDKEN